MRWIAIFLLGCGRLGFDAANHVAADGPAVPPPDAERPSLAEALPCNTPALLDDGGHLPHDTLVWVYEPEADWLIGVEHQSQDVHMIERHALVQAPGPGGVFAGPSSVIEAVDHVDVLRFEPVAAGGYVLGYNEFVLQTGHTLRVTPDMVETASQSFGTLAQGNPPLARAGHGGLAMIGLTSNDLEVIGIGDDGVATGAADHLATPAEGAGLPNLLALDDGLLAVWHSSARGTCRLAKLRPDLSIAVGPVDMTVAGCSDAHAAWLPASRRIIAVADNTSDGSSAVAVWDENLVPVTPPQMLAPIAHWSRIVDDGDGAWVAWAESTSPQTLRHARLDPTGQVTMMSAGVGMLDDSLGHYHTLQRVGPSTVALWTDTVASRTFSAMRLCQ